MTCYMTAATNEWIRVAWRNEKWKKQVSLKKEAEKAIGKVEVIYHLINSAPTPAWVYKASRTRVCGMAQQYFESVSGKMGYRKWTAP